MDAARELPRYRSSASRARVTSWLLLANVAIAVAQVLGLLLTVFVLPSAQFNTLAGLLNVLGWIASGAFIATAMAFMAWLSRAIDNVPALGGGTPSASPRWAIAWWFIPFANLGMPYEVVRDLDARMSDQPRAGHPILLVAWWFTFVGSVVLSGVAVELGTDTARAAITTYAVGLASVVLTAAAAVLAVFVVRRIERAASARAALPAEPFSVAAREFIDSQEASDRRTGWRMRPSWVGFVAITGSFAVAAALLVIAGSGKGTASGALPHEAPSLEAGLPSSVAGEQLEHWSMQGEHYFVAAGGLDAAGLAQLKTDLAKNGLVIDDVAFAVDGRASLSDAPYFVNAFRVRGVQAASLPTNIAIDHPGAGTFTAVTIAGKQVRRGTAAMLEQNEHQRGTPYVYDAGEVRYIIITDSESWATDALRQLP